MLNRYQPGDRVSDEDGAELADLIKRHPEYAEKSGVGVDHFEVQSADYGTQCFRVVRSDGTWERFSYLTCISPARAA
ncbi:DCL family protein [Methylobacterium sp. 22177]|uniref:DCL family protein n=1 Tax=Methylobacterium sp. 22177 TaxID=3453885 RepID=UPI003F83411C